MDLLLPASVAGLVMGCIYALVSLGLGLIWGVMDVVNFAHAEYMMLAMYATYYAWAWLHLSPFAALPAVIALGFGAGVATYLLLIRRITGAPMVTQIFATFGLLFFLRYLAFAVFGPDFRGIAWEPANGSIEILGVPVSTAKAWAAGAALLTFAALHGFLQYTKVGKAVRATAQSPGAALALGIEVERIYMLAWGLSIATAAVAGVFLLPFYQVSPTVADAFLLLTFASVVLGGFGSLLGPLIGGVAIGLIEGIAGTLLSPTFKLVFVFAVFLLVLFVRPRGLLGEWGA
ncbi:MAG TPA: branched-chain amino acid ABC transporter permease [bacterium]|nr:branched-chain amino acid ABC transporter permease [bacterium]